MKKLKILAFLLITTPLIAQQNIEPNYGLAMSATGISVFTFGLAIKSSLVIQQYNPKYGYNNIIYNSVDKQRLKATTLLFGAMTTITGIIIQNIKRKKRKNG